MSKENQETVADILAEMRRDGHSGPADALEWVQAKLEFYAGRIEAASKRELLSNSPKNDNSATANDTGGKQGNAAKLRKALVGLRDASRDFYNQILNSKYCRILDKYTCEEQGFSAALDIVRGISDANAAIAELPRNCDVCGTVAELRERHLYFCPKQKGCEKRYCDYFDVLNCFIELFQMPNEMGGAK